MAKFSNQNITQAIYQILKDKSGTEYSRALKNVAQFLARKRLFSQVPQILSKLQTIIDKEQGVLRVRLESARVLNGTSGQELEKFLKKRYGAKEIIFDKTIDEQLFGGARLEIGDEVIDLTLKNKVRKLREHLLAS